MCAQISPNHLRSTIATLSLDHPDYCFNLMDAVANLVLENEISLQVNIRSTMCHSESVTPLANPEDASEWRAIPEMDPRKHVAGLRMNPSFATGKSVLRQLTCSRQCPPQGMPTIRSKPI